MKSEWSHPIGIKAEHDRDLNFGICENCNDIGVKLLKYHGWVCHKCANSMLRSRGKSEGDSSN